MKMLAAGIYQPTLLFLKFLESGRRDPHFLIRDRDGDRDLSTLEVLIRVVCQIVEVGGRWTRNNNRGVQNKRRGWICWKKLK